MRTFLCRFSSSLIDSLSRLSPLSNHVRANSGYDCKVHERRQGWLGLRVSSTQTAICMLAMVTHVGSGR